MSRTRYKFKNRRDSKPFIMLPHHVMDSHNWINASPSAKQIVLDIARQFNGRNNGNLDAVFSRMKKRGWNSQTTLNWAIKEALHYGLIIKTRQGDLTKKPSLYAITWENIDDIGYKLELCRPTTKPTNEWKHIADIYNRKSVPILKRKNKILMQE